MVDVLLDGFLDTLKLLPYLLITFIILEFIEHKLNNKNQKILIENRKYGPLVGGILGGIPQCGFSSMAANLYSRKVITMGTLIAVFLSTSDEMLPIMISKHVNFEVLIKIVIFKIIVGILIGFIIDLIYHKKIDSKNFDIREMCEEDHCSCNEDGILLSSVKHTLKIAFFILVVNLLINIIIFKIGEDNLAKLLLDKNIITYFIASLIGLIPNCASSIIITELYLSGLITIGNLLAGLLTGSGLGILLLFKTNKNLKENISILTIIYLLGAVIGIIVDLIM